MEHDSRGAKFLKGKMASISLPRTLGGRYERVGMAAMVLLAVLRICSVPDGMNSCLPLPA